MLHPRHVPPQTFVIEEAKVVKVEGEDERLNAHVRWCSCARVGDAWRWRISGRRVRGAANCRAGLVLGEEIGEVHERWRVS